MSKASFVIERSTRKSEDFYSQRSRLFAHSAVYSA